MPENIQEIRIPPKLELWAKVTLIMANIAIFLGIGFAVVQYSNAMKRYSQAERFNTEQRLQAITFEKTKNAIEAVNKVNNNEFISSLAKLKGNKNLKNNEMINAWNFVFNTYYSIAIVYNNNIADNQIIKKSIKQEIINFVELPSFKDTPIGDAENEILKMVNSINKNSE